MLHRYRRFDGRMRIVALQCEILVAEIVDVFDLRVQVHFGQRPEVTRKLFPDLILMVLIDVQIAKGVHKIARFQSGDLRHHHGQERVGGNVERHPQKKIRAALVKLAAETVAANIELEKGVARRQSHLIQLARIPGRNDQAAAVRGFPYLLDDVVYLIDRAAVGRSPVTPLRTVDAAQIAVLIGPFVPDSHLVVMEILDIRIAAQEPEQLMDDGTQMDLFGGQQRKGFAQREPGLGTEHGQSPDSGAVRGPSPFGQNQF